MELIKELNDLISNSIKDFCEIEDYFSKEKSLINHYRRRHLKSGLNTFLKDNDYKKFIIFETNKKNVESYIPEYGKKFVFPFKNIFIKYPVIVNEENRRLSFSYGFFVIEHKEKGNNVFIIINMIHGFNIPDGEPFSYPSFSVLIADESFNYRFDNKFIYTPEKQVHESTELTKEEMHKVILSVISSIGKKEYTTYKKWSPSGLETKQIVYSSEVSSHKRHFWKDSDYFLIPKMNRDEWEKMGYGTDEIVVKDGEIKENVPYKNINSFVRNEEKEKREDNRIIELYKRRHFRKEESLGKILHELFPNSFIKRHDRKTLNGLELDFNIRELKLAFEYDGEQHFDKKLCEEVFGSNFNDLQNRDRKKDVRCNELGIRLIRVKYDETLNKQLIKKKLKQIGVKL